MGDPITLHKMYKYRLFRADKKDWKLRHKLFVASTVWNHFIALQRRYHRLMGKYISLNAMNKHVLLAKGRPRFRKAKNYASFTFPQSGYQFVSFNQNEVKDDEKYTRARASLKIEGVTYRFVQHRPMLGEIKTLTVKRDSVGRLWVVFSVEETMSIPETRTGKSGGFDFGLKTFLTDDEGRAYTSPQFFAQGIEKTRKLHRQLSRKVEGSHRRKRARRTLPKHSADVANKRRDHHFQLAHRLCDEYAILYFEDLNLAGMKALWGRKVSDLGFPSFVSILEWVALKRGKSVVKIGRFTPTTKTCSGCGQRYDLTLRDRVLAYDCGLTIDRDHNAAINIKHGGASLCYRSDDKTKIRLRSRIEGRSPRL